MADLRIVDAPLLSTVKGTEKIPTGGEGNFSVSVNQVADFAKLKWFLATEGYVDNAVGNVQADLNLHKNSVSNPHGVTKLQVGLGNVDNTADLDKPVSNATRSAIITANSGKADKSYVDSQDQLKADKNTVEASLLLKADKVDLKASKIASDGNQTQQEINDFGGAKWYSKSGGYGVGATAKLDNGDTVRSTEPANTVNPNVDMAGWIKSGDAKNLFFELSSFYASRSLFDKVSEKKSISDYLIAGEDYTAEFFDWSPVFERAIQALKLSGGGSLFVPKKEKPYALSGIIRTDGQLVGIEIPFSGGSDFGSTSTKIDLVGESQAVRFIPLQNDMIVIRHCSSYCEVGKFQIHHNDKLRCHGLSLTPQNWVNPASTSQQSHNYIHDIYTYGMLESLVLQSGGLGGCYYNTIVNFYAAGLISQGARGLALKAGIRSVGQVTKASPPNRNRFYNFKAFSTNVGVDIESGGTNYFYGVSVENNKRAGSFASTPTGFRIIDIDSEGHINQGNIIYGLSVEEATRDADITCTRTAIYGHTLDASKTVLSSNFVSSGHGKITGAYDQAIFPEIDSGVITLLNVVPTGLPAYEYGKTYTSSLGIHDVGGRFKAYSITKSTVSNSDVVSGAVAYVQKFNNRVDFDFRFNFRPLANNSTMLVALPYNANFNLYSKVDVNSQAFAIPVYIQCGGTSTRQLAFARIVSKDATTATHLEVLAPTSGWNMLTEGEYNSIHAHINYRSA